MKAKPERSIRVLGGGAYLRPVGRSKTHFKNPKTSFSKRDRFLRLHETCVLAANRGLKDVQMLAWVRQVTGYPESEIMQFLSDHYPVDWSRVRNVRRKNA